MEIDPTQISVGERYKLMIGCIVPRPIAWVSTISPDGANNLAPFSYFNGVGSDPMTVVFCPGNAIDGSEKDTLVNCKPESEGGVGEFVVNLVPERIGRQMSGTAEPLPHGESEFALAGLTPAASRHVRPPRVAESPVSFECKTLQVVRTNPGVPGGGNLVLGEIVHLVLDDDLVDERFRVDLERLGAIGRLGGHSYCRLTDRFSIPRGRAALEEG